MIKVCISDSGFGLWFPLRQISWIILYTFSALFKSDLKKFQNMIIKVQEIYFGSNFILHVLCIAPPTVERYLSLFSHGNPCLLLLLLLFLIYLLGISELNYLRIHFPDVLHESSCFSCVVMWTYFGLCDCWQAWDVAGLCLGPEAHISLDLRGNKIDGNILVSIEICIKTKRWIAITEDSTLFMWMLCFT